jgi:hypothetical protein
MDCSRQVLNWSSISQHERFDKISFDKEKLKQNVNVKSPKILSLIQQIVSLDKEDMAKSKKLYKHYIFTSVKNSAKMIASALISFGFSNVMIKSKNKIILSDEKMNEKHNFKLAVLSSVALYDLPSANINRKNILDTFNSVTNIHGDSVRFIILDQGFLEGIDLMDTKYCHIFEQSLTQTVLEQAIGRGKRFCGHKNLKYQKEGWILKTFIAKI